MAYTKQQLIQAFCRAKNCDVSQLSQFETQIQENIDRHRQEIQNRLDAFPTTAKQRMKKIALEQLAKEEAEQAVIDNSGVSL